MIRSVGLLVGTCGMFLMVGSLLCARYEGLIFLCGLVGWLSGWLMLAKGDKENG